MDATMRSVRAPNKNIRITKWKVKPGQQVSQGAILCIYETDGAKSLKIKSSDVGTVHEIMGQEGDRKPPGSVLVTIEPCKHPTVMKDMCAECGADLREEAGLAGERREPVTATVAMVHSIPELIISEEQAREIGREDENRLLKTNKLVLLVDLDQTLIHTTNDSIPANLKGVFHYQLRHGNGLMWYHTRIRPGTQHFLETISKMYELHICTFGVRMYAHTIARFLDPEEKYFSHRILSRDECFNPNSKTANLKALFPCGDKMVCIIDDREDVWNFAPNLIHVKPYRFFQGTADINAPPGLTKNEHDSEPVHHQVRRVSRSHSVDKEKEGEEVKVDDKEIKGDNSKSVMEGESDKSELNVVSGDIETENKDDIKQNAKQDESENIFVDKLNEMKTEHSVDNGTKKLSGSHSDSENNNQNVRDPIDSVIEKTECVDQSELEINNDMNQSEKKEESDNINSKSKYADDTNSEEVDKNKITSTIEINNDMNQSEKKEESDNVNSTSKYADDTNSEEVDKNKIISTIETKSKETDDDVGSRENMEETGMEIDNKTPDEIDKTEDESSLSLSKETKTKESEGANSDDAINEEANIDNLADDDIEIEWDDEDDYLLYLEEILTRIHKTFFDFNDELKSKKEKNEIPDLKDIISYIKRKVLQGVNVVFSGVFPTNIVPEKSRAFIVAKALGANVHTNIIPKSDVEKGLSTTHLVAAKLGTSKVRMAQKVKGIKIVNPNWLWSCAERYEHVDERLFPLDKESYKMENCDSPDVTKDKNRKRKPDPEEVSDESNSGKRPRKSDGESAQILVDDNSNEASTSVQTAENENPVFVSTFNPLLAFSDDDLACMDKEVEEIMDEDQDNNSSEDEMERDSRMRSFVLSENASSSEDSLSGDLPRGWKRKDSGSSESPGNSEHGRNNDIESENDLEKFENTVIAFAPDSESDNDSIGSMDDEMAAAIEKEFLEL